MILDENFLRCRSSNITSKYHKELMIARSGVSTRSISSYEGLSRRDLVLIGLSSPLSMLLPLSPGNVFCFYCSSFSILYLRLDSFTSSSHL